MFLRARAISPLIVVLLLISAPASVLAQCGVERWSVKTGTDADAGQVNLSSATSTTVANMRAFTTPNPIPPNNRVAPAETTEWVINATLTLYKLESDSDYHLVLQDASGNTMITEIPSPSCVGAGSPFFAGIQNARAEFDARFTATTSFQTANIPVQVKGVGMFDFPHGQTGAAPNQIELHPVLDIIFNPGSNPDFTVGASPASLSVTQGSSGSSTISTAINGGFNSAISLSVSGLPAGVSASFNPSSIAAPGSGSSTLTFSATSTATTGTFTATVTASGSGITHTTAVAVTVNPATSPDFTVSASPSSLSVTRGTSGSLTISTTVSGGFNSAVALSASGLPAGVTVSFNPTSIAAPGNGSSTLTFTASNTATIGTSSVTVTATGGGVTHTTAVSLTIPQTNIFGIVPPDHVVVVMEENHSFSSIIGSTSAPYINNLAQQGALFTQSFAVEHPSQPNYLDLFSGSNQGVTDDSCPHTFSGENLASELTTASLTFTGFSEDLPSAGSTACTSGAYARKHSPWINFTNVATSANQPFTSFPTDFTTLPTLSFVIPNLNNDMHDGTIAQGDTWLQQHIDPYLQFAQTHNSLLIVTWDEDDSSSGNQIPTIFIGPMVKQGQFSETINHFNVLRTLEDLYGLTHVGGAATATPISDVWKQATADFSVSASPASLSVTQGSSGSSTISTTVSGGFNADVSLSATGLPSGVSASFNPATISAPGGGSSALTFTASNTATTGTANVTVTGTGGGVTHTTTISLTITPAATADFSVTALPASVSVTQGASETSTISTTVSGGFNSAISLTASGLPSGVTATFNPTSIAAPGSGSSTVTFAATSTAITGTVSVTVTSSGGGVTHTTTVSLTVTASGGGGTVQVLGNPGFENGSSNPAPWVVTTSTSTNRIINSSSSEATHSGSWDAWLDGHGSTTTDTLMQQVSIPSNATAATLSFWLHIDTAETTTTTAYDKLMVQVRNASGTVLSTLATYSNLNHASGYQQKTFDLTSFKGQTIQIFLKGQEDYTLQTSFVLDDFALNVTTPGAPPTTSITSPVDGATVSGTVTITATASSSTGVTQMQILIDGAVAASNTNSTTISFNWDTTSVANGSHTIVSKAFDANGGVGTSPTVTVTVSNSGGTTTELIGNGGFENGSANPAPWTTTSGVINNSSSEPPHGGSWDAWLDGYGTTHTDTVAQQVTIPANATAGTLSFWLHIDTAETTTTTAYDVFTVQVLDTSGTVLSTLATFSNLNAATGYQQHTYDVTSFKGQTIQIYFKGVEDYTRQTSFVIDDVSLMVTQ